MADGLLWGGLAPCAQHRQGAPVPLPWPPRPPPSPLLGLPTLPRLLPPGTHPAPPATSHTPRRPPQATYDLEVEKARVKERSSSPASIIPQRDPSNELEERCLAPSAKAAAPAPRDIGLRKRAK